MKTLGVIQARMSSTRLPGKVLRPIEDTTWLDLLVSRVSRSQKIDQLVLATTVKSSDDVLADWAKARGLGVFRGSEPDVLSRFAETALAFGADLVVRLTSDDPLKDPDLIDQTWDLCVQHQADYASNNTPPRYPEGLDVEIMSAAALQRAHREARDPFEREHVTPYFKRHPEIFNAVHLIGDEDLSFLRWTLDTAEDEHFLTSVCQALALTKRHVGYQDIITFCQSHPDLVEVNRHVQRSHLYRQSN